MEDLDINKREIIEVVNELGCEEKTEDKSDHMEEESKTEQENSSGMVDEVFEVIMRKDSEEGNSEPHRKMKEAERVIRQVIMAVKTWRALYEGKVCNLTKAAQVVGMSKKSLDDYYLVLRTGDKLGFDYPHNLDRKMGEIRAFIKSNEERVTGKLGKEVKCFSLVEPVHPHQVLAEWNARGEV